jgi:hypothetical protein
VQTEINTIENTTKHDATIQYLQNLLNTLLYLRPKLTAYTTVTFFPTTGCEADCYRGFVGTVFLHRASVPAYSSCLVG